MIFKPRIFISSLMKGKMKLRKDLEDFFSSIGAEVLLYESTLTPSTNKNTYRQDILDSDFVIVILDKNYGSKTDSGLSGTEEEYNIATENKLKAHVYIQKIRANTSIDSKQQEFISKIKKSGISYYEYKTESDLIHRIKSTVMQISHEIVLNKLSTETVPRDVCHKISSDFDYQVAIRIISIYEHMKAASKIYGICESDVIIGFWHNISEQIRNDDLMFIDSHYCSLLKNAIAISDEIIEKMSYDFCAGTNYSSIKIPYLGEVLISKNEPAFLHMSVNRDWYYSKWQDFNEAFEKFIDYVKEQRIRLDATLID